MTKELPQSKMDYKKSARYKRAIDAQNNNEFYKFYKASPEKYPIDAGCCAVRAICTAEGVPFEEAERELLAHLMSIGYGFYAYADIDYLTAHYPKQTFKAVKGQKRMNGRMFAKEHRHGSYVLNMAGHLTACVEGVILDTWDCTKNCVYASWEVKAP